MALGRAALGAAQIVPAVLLEGCAAPRSRSASSRDRRRLSSSTVRGPIVFWLLGRTAGSRSRGGPDIRLALGRVVVEDPGLAVVVEEQRGSMPPTVGSHTGSDHGPGRILGRDQEIAAAIDAGVEDVERPRPAPGSTARTRRATGPALEVEHAGPVDRVADLGPVDEVGGMEDRDAGEIGEGRIDQVEVLAHARDAGIGIEAVEDRVAILPGVRLVGAITGSAPRYSNQSKRATGCAAAGAASRNASRARSFMPHNSPG
jgi:hypothetical protein